MCGIRAASKGIGLVLWQQNGLRPLVSSILYAAMFDVVLGSVVLAGTSGIRSVNGKTGIADAMSAQSKVLELFGQPSRNNDGQEDGQSSAAERLREAERRRGLRLADLNSKLEKCAEELTKKDKAIMAEYELALRGIEEEYEQGNARIENLKKEAGFRSDLSVREKDAARRAIAIEEARVETEYEKAKANAKSDREKAKYDLEVWAEKFAKASESEEARIEQGFQEELEQIDMAAQGQAGQSKNDPRPSLPEDDAAPFAENSLKKPLGFNNLARPDEGKLPEPPAPKDESDLFGVSRIEIEGANEISEAELLDPKILPIEYIEEDATSNAYDFRAFHEILKQPGVRRQVSKRDIQGLTKYILWRYSEKDYAGIYVYVPQDSIDENKNEFRDGTLVIKVIEGRVAEPVAIKYYNFDREETEKAILKDSVLKSNLILRIAMHQIR